MASKWLSILTPMINGLLAARAARRQKQGNNMSLKDLVALMSSGASIKANKSRASYYDAMAEKSKQPKEAKPKSLADMKAEIVANKYAGDVMAFERDMANMTRAPRRSGSGRPSKYTKADMEMDFIKNNFGGDYGKFLEYTKNLGVKPKETDTYQKLKDVLPSTKASDYTDVSEDDNGMELKVINPDAVNSALETVTELEGAYGDKPENKIMLKSARRQLEGLLKKSKVGDFSGMTGKEEE